MMMSNREPNALDVVIALILGFVFAFGGCLLFEAAVIHIVDTNYDIPRNISNE
jgi:hypothetical protein